MPNHVHFLVVPQHEDNSARLFRSAHRKYTLRINLAHAWRGHSWQERFHSSVMDEGHLMSCVRYIELNPVRAGFCDLPEDWEGYLRGAEDEFSAEEKRRLSRTGRPGGNDEFIECVEAIAGRDLKLKKAGRKPSASNR